MATATSKMVLTADDLLAMPGDGKGYEVVDGSLVELSRGAESSWIAGRFAHFLTGFQEGSPIGWVFPADAGIQCFPWDPGRVRKPDASFVRFGRFPGEEIPQGHSQVAPDLVIEVVSPNDLAYEVEARINDYLRAGVRLVWIVYPSARIIRIDRLDGTFDRLTEADEIDGEDVLPGFRRPVRDFFPRRPAAEGSRP